MQDRSWLYYLSDERKYVLNKYLFLHLMDIYANFTSKIPYNNMLKPSCFLTIFKICHDPTYIHAWSICTYTDGFSEILKATQKMLSSQRGVCLSSPRGEYLWSDMSLSQNVLFYLKERVQHSHVRSQTSFRCLLSWIKLFSELVF